MDNKGDKKNEIKKIFSKYSRVNFFQDYTLQDLEDAKKKYYFEMCKEGKNKEQLQTKIDEMANVLIAEKFNPNTPPLTVGSIVKNTVKDNLNPTYKNTIKRLINLDSQYRPNLSTSESSYVAHLTEKLDNVVSIEVENLQIPFTFYNIETAQGNNTFYINGNKITIDNGHYDLDALLSAINTKLTSYSVTFANIAPEYKTTITGTFSIVFYNSDNDNEYTKYNNNLGWMLGFRNVQYNEDNTITMTYVNTCKAEAVACVTDTKYVVIAIDEYNKNITNGTLVQTKLDTCTIKPTMYWNYQDSKCLQGVTCDNINSYINKNLTRSQLYSQAQFNTNKSQLNQQALRLDCNTPNNVLGLVPFENKSSFGDYFFTDKVNYKREYHGPIDIEKLQIQLFNDKGFPLTFNGVDWNITLSTEHLYKY